VPGRSFFKAFGTDVWTKPKSGPSGQVRGHQAGVIATSDLDYLEARYYSGDKARFLSQDLVFWLSPGSQNIQRPQSLNSYAYGNGNPIVNSDPDGREALGLSIGLNAEGSLGFISAAATINIGVTYVRNPETGEIWFAPVISGGVHSQAFGSYVSYPASKEIPTVLGVYGGPNANINYSPNAKRP
jgi:RHS repeat-associated protein